MSGNPEQLKSGTQTTPDHEKKDPMSEQKKQEGQTTEQKKENSGISDAAIEGANKAAEGAKNDAGQH